MGKLPLWVWVDSRPKTEAHLFDGPLELHSRMTALCGKTSSADSRRPCRAVPNGMYRCRKCELEDMTNKEIAERIANNTQGKGE